MSDTLGTDCEDCRLTNVSLRSSTPTPLEISKLILSPKFPSRPGYSKFFSHFRPYDNACDYCNQVSRVM